MVKVRQLRNERKAQEYLEDHEIEKLLKIFDRSYFPEHRDFMVIMLILDTGMRLGECLQVTVDDVDMNDRTICLQAENLDSGMLYKQAEAMTGISKSTPIRGRSIELTRSV